MNHVEYIEKLERSGYGLVKSEKVSMWAEAGRAAAFVAFLIVFILLMVAIG